MSIARSAEVERRGNVRLDDAGRIPDDDRRSA
jgi:hypothetical protein